MKNKEFERKKQKKREKTQKTEIKRIKMIVKKTRNKRGIYAKLTNFG